MRKNSNLILLLFVFACKPDFDSKRIKIDFSEEFPTYKFISSDFGIKGDSTFVNIKFKKPTSERIWVDKWIYVIDSKGWILDKTGKTRLIKPLKPTKYSSIRETLNQLKLRSIKIDSVLFSRDTLDFISFDLVTNLIYHCDTLNELTYIPEGDSISIIHQRHLGNIHIKPYKFQGDTID